MAESTEVKEIPTSAITVEDKVSVSLVFRGVPKEKRVQLERFAKEFSKKHRKLVNYIEK